MKDEVVFLNGKSYLPVTVYVPVANDINVIDLTELGEYGVIYADPAWQYESPGAVYEHSRIENSYQTMPLEEIMAMRVPKAKNCALYLWCPPALLDYGKKVMAAWGFEYVTNHVWEKISDRAGLGYTFEIRHEHLLYGRRGKIGAPAERFPSVIRARARAHSQKPELYYGLIERSYPGKKRIELFARERRINWDAWGNESNVGSSMVALDRFFPGEQRKPKTLEDFQ